VLAMVVKRQDWSNELCGHCAIKTSYVRHNLERFLVAPSYVVEWSTNVLRIFFIPRDPLTQIGANCNGCKRLHVYRRASLRSESDTMESGMDTLDGRCSSLVNGCWLRATCYVHYCIRARLNNSQRNCDRRHNESWSVARWLSVSLRYARPACYTPSTERISHH